MAKTWQNYQCTFFTGNTANTRGDSKYLVLAGGMTRTALVNFRRAPNQVLSKNPSIAYLDPNSNLYRHIMNQPDDSKISIDSVMGDRIIVRVKLATPGPHVGHAGLCTRMPADGLVTFDFVNDNGVLSHIHIGHAVHDLSMGRPRRYSI